MIAVHFDPSSRPIRLEEWQLVFWWGSFRTQASAKMEEESCRLLSLVTTFILQSP